MSSERPSNKGEREFVDFYFEMSKLQRESTGQDREYWKHIALDDLDDSDMKIYKIVQEEILRIRSFDHMRPEDNKQFSPLSGLPPLGPNIKDLLKDRFDEVAVKGKDGQKAFAEYLSHKFREAWGAESDYSSQPQKEEGNGPTQL